MKGENEYEKTYEKQENMDRSIGSSFNCGGSHRLRWK